MAHWLKVSITGLSGDCFWYRAGSYYNWLPEGSGGNGRHKRYTTEGESRSQVQPEDGLQGRVDALTGISVPGQMTRTGNAF
ncbi:hypothetical protein OHD52_26645 [Escherichia coli]|nr:hypothetical protein [Escherichia coli]